MFKGFIHKSSSPFVAPVLYAKKPDGGLQFCIEYRTINKKPLQHWYPLPLIWERLGRLGKFMISTKFDVRGVYTYLSVNDGYENELTFHMKCGMCKPTVMQFGATIAKSDFQGYIDNAIREVLDNFAFAYLEVVLVYGDSSKEDVVHVE